MAEPATENPSINEVFNNANTSSREFHNSDSFNLINNCENTTEGVEKNSCDKNCVIVSTVQNLYQTECEINNENDEDIEIAKIDPASRRSFINKPAYAKLHRSLSLGNNRRSVSKLKGRYENIDKPTTNPTNTTIESNTNSAKSNKDSSCEKTETTNKPNKLTEEVQNTKLTDDAVELLKTKYSPASFGYPKISPSANASPADKASRIPLPKPRRAIKSEIHITPQENETNLDGSTQKANSTEILTNSNKKSKDENSNLLHRPQLNKIEFDDPEDRHLIVRQSASEESIDKISEELSHFIMEKKSKEHKRSNSFRRIFSGGFFGRDKKKKEDDKNKLKVGENIVYTDNIQNETNAFNRQSVHRHTIGSSAENKDVINYTNQNPVIEQDFRDNKTHDVDQRYAEMHINRFNQIRDNFANLNKKNEDYLAMDNSQPRKKPTISDYISVPVKKYIDTSSSTTSNSELDKANTYENALEAQIENRRIDFNSKPNESRNSSTERKSRFNDSYSDNFRQTPPRAQETYQDFKLIKPKASIPINSERPLPNPYQNNDSTPNKEPKSTPRTIERNLNRIDNKNYPDKQNLSSTNNNNNNNNNRPYVDEVYGTVFDSLEYSSTQNGGLKPVRNSLKITANSPTSPIPKSPSLESSKLKLPPNRQIYSLQPRVKSPIPFTKVSTEKLIATELLKNSRSPTPPRKTRTVLNINEEHMGNENGFLPDDTIKNQEHYVESGVIKAKPPISPKPLNLEKFSEWQRKPKDATVPVVPPDKIVTNALVHTPSPKKQSQTINELEFRNRSLSPIRLQTVRSSTPVDLRLSTNLKLSPQKDDIRKNVEAYYWKELKKMKEQEDYELYMMQLSSNGYLDEPVRVRRSRSLSPSVQRVGRRSLSLPREVKPVQATYNAPQYNENPYGRMMQPQPIPEGRALMDMTDSRARRQLNYRQLQYPTNFIRNTPERQTIGSFGENLRNIDENSLNDSLQRPIFKRGSLNKQEPIDLQTNGNKKVSFTSIRNLQSWPTRNGYTQSPPQRRTDKREGSVDDEVFLPNSTQMLDNSNQYKQLNYNQYGDNVYGYARQQQANADPIYAVKTNQNFEPRYGQANLLYYQGRPPVVRGSYKQIVEPQYVQRDFPVDSQKLSYESLNMYANQNHLPSDQSLIDSRRSSNASQRREVVITDNIYGQFGGYQQNRSNSQMSLTRNDYLQQRENNQNPLYSSRQSVADSVSGRQVQKQISVNNKVCDIYGQIHDQQNIYQPQFQKTTGVLLGQLQRTPNSPMTNRQNYSQQPPQNFVRGTRLTASANDMGKRYTSNDLMYIQQNFDEFAAPNRPLPPIPKGKKVSVRYPQISDTESGSDASEIQRIMNKNGKNKKRGFFGK